VQWASFLSAVQRLTPQRLHGQLMGAVESLGALCPGIGLLLGGLLVAVGTPRSAFLIVGAGAALTTIAFIRLAANAALEPASELVGAGREASPGAPPDVRELPPTGPPGPGEIGVVRDQPADPHVSNTPFAP
jgi:hypothetical protein